MLAGLKTDEPEESQTAPNDSLPAEEQPRETQKGKLNVVIDRKGRKGKVATIIEGFTISDAEVEALASELKRRIGTGGSSRGGEILLQGDWKEKVTEILKSKNYKV